MPSIQELKQQIEQRADPVQIIGRFVPLKRRGAEWLGLCPFHDERTPSFVVSPAKKIFKCFGCGAGGDIYTFLQKYQGLGFMDAIAVAAELSGTPVSMEQEKHNGEPQKRESVLVKNTVPKPILAKTLSHYEDNEFACFLAGLVGWEQTLETLLRFYVGTARQRGTIFWQVDQFLRVRTGARVMYGKDGKRRKDIDVKRLYTTGDGFTPCLYGEHQLLEASRDALFAIVESEKTAIVCNLWQPIPAEGREVVYLASSGMNGLTDDKIWPLRGLRVCLCPDFGFGSRMVWGARPMLKKRNEKGHLVPHPDGEPEADYVSVAARLQKQGCEVTFFDPYPEREDKGDLADVLLAQPLPGPRLRMPDARRLTLEEQPFE